ncbi:hypothetical protein DY000_02036645 [Brassica cretica]|uniref:DUF4005 domain-containing protein n=1 Tax=Brassica cretica TaxID=69181 RepID=A0ABQ7BD38_BRACR|nr:hypothetical protein DY000_02036645 [Brassica cretica]
MEGREHRSREHRNYQQKDQKTSTARETRVTLPYTRHRRVITASSPRHRRSEKSPPVSLTDVSPQSPETKSHHSSLENQITLPRRAFLDQSRSHPEEHQHTHHASAYRSTFIGDQSGGSTNRRKHQPPTIDPTTPTIMQEESSEFRKERQRDRGEQSRRSNGAEKQPGF